MFYFPYRSSLYPEPIPDDACVTEAFGRDFLWALRTRLADGIDESVEDFCGLLA